MSDAFKMFSDYNGATVEISRWDILDNAAFATMFPGVRGIRYDGFRRYVGKTDAGLIPVTRYIRYKSRPSLHACSAKCMNGKHNGTCECRCGGKNHGVSH